MTTHAGLQTAPLTGRQDAWQRLGRQLWLALGAPCPLERPVLLATWALALLLAALLAGCGGGDAAAGGDRGPVAAAPAWPAAAAATSAPEASTLAQAMRRHALAVSANSVSAADAAQQLLDYAERRFPEYFPTGPATASAASFAYRFYPSTGVYLGVMTSGGTPYVEQGVYVMGGAFGAAPSFVGRVSDFITPVDAKVQLDVSQAQAVVQQGGFRSVTLTVARQGGYSGPVQIDVAGLPTGVSARPLTLPAGTDSAELMLDALASAPHSLPTTTTVRAWVDGVAVSQPLTVTVRGRPGQLDTSFAGGVNVTPVDIGEDYTHAMAVQADGKVLVAGSAATVRGTQIAVLRYGRDGGLDTSFGTGGKVLLAAGSRGNDAAYALAVQADGRIVVAGASDQGATGLDMVVLRLQANGQLDTSFANGGKLVVDFAGDSDRAWALALQDDGRIVVGGEANRGATTTGVDFALLRLTAAGALDASFGQGGKVTTALKSNTGSDVLRALALPVIDGQTHVLAVGGDGDFLAARYRPDGALDTRFGAGGKVVGLFNANIGGARGVALLPDGRAVLAGHVNHQFAAAQLTTTGQLDASFGTAGRVERALVANWNEATAIVRQSDGRLILAGWAYSGAGSSGDFAALRLTATGQVDTAFADGGTLVLPVAAGTRNDQAQALVLQTDERVPTVRALVAGEANASNHDLVLLRLWL